MPYLTKKTFNVQILSLPSYKSFISKLLLTQLIYKKYLIIIIYYVPEISSLNKQLKNKKTCFLKEVFETALRRV